MATNQGIVLDVGALDFWFLKYDPFNPVPLNFEGVGQFDYLVKTGTISTMNDIHKQIQLQPLSAAIPTLLLGDRGGGKTSAMSYLGYVCRNQVPKIDYIECNVQVDATDVYEFRLAVHASILEELVDYVGDNRVRAEATSAVVTKNIEIIDNTIKRVARMMVGRGDKRIIFLDNLDKPSPNYFKIVKEYFQMEQGFYEMLLRVPGTHVVISLQPFVGREFSNSKELNTFGGKPVHIKSWSIADLDDLLARRLKAACKLEAGIPLDKYMVQSARTLLYWKNFKNPRGVILGFKALLQTSYEVQTEKRKGEKVPKDMYEGKSIDLDFVKTHQREAVGVEMFDNRLKIKIDDIAQDLSRLYFESWDLLRECVAKSPSDAYELIETLILIGQGDDLEENGVIGVLMNVNLVVRKGPSAKFRLADGVADMFEYLSAHLNGDADFVRYFLVTRLL